MKFIQTNSPSISQNYPKTLGRLGGVSGAMHFLGFGPCINGSKIRRIRPQETKANNAQVSMIIVGHGAIAADMYVKENAHRKQWASIAILETKTVSPEVIPGTTSACWDPVIIISLEEKFALTHYLPPGWILKTVIGMDLSVCQVDTSLYPLLLHLG